MKRNGLLFTTMLVLASLIISACTSTRPEAVEKSSQSVEQGGATAEDASPPESKSAPAVGGAMVLATSSDPDTLDPQQTTGNLLLPELIQGTLMAIDPETDELVPYLAESIDVSEDGLTWDIVLKQGITFHDGVEFTAHDYVWTLERAAGNPSPTTGPMLDGLDSAEAVDDYTVRLHFETPNHAMLYGMTTAILAPLPQAYIEQVGDAEFARHPIGAGPYQFKEWAVGEKVVFERNPDFEWGPAFTQGGPPNIETLEFRIIPEYATRLAGLEAGELDYGYLENKDIAHIQDVGGFEIITHQDQGMGPNMVMNVSKPPFDSLQVRQAFNLAVNREALIKVVLLGYGEPAHGPLTPSTRGYWPGVEEISYGYDLEQAQALMVEAGYALNDDGMLEKDGQPLKLILKVAPSSVKPAEVMQAQYKELGVDLKIQTLEFGVLQEDIANGDYDLAFSTWDWAEASILFPTFASVTIGFMNEGQINDPELDEILFTAFGAPSTAISEEYYNEAQRYIVEQAYVAPLFSATSSYALADGIKGLQWTEGGRMILFDAYIETTAP